MRYARHNKILELIAAERIETQEELAEQLRRAGFAVTQATVSRDIKDLQLVKVSRGGGRSFYSRSEKAGASPRERYEKILRETVQSVQAAENLVVIKTLSGCGNAAAEAIDSFEWQGVVGSIAGDNTIFLAIDSKENAPGLASELRRIVG